MSPPPPPTLASNDCFRSATVLLCCCAPFRADIRLEHREGVDLVWKIATRSSLLLLLFFFWRKQRWERGQKRIPSCNDFRKAYKGRHWQHFHIRPPPPPPAKTKPRIVSMVPVKNCCEATEAWLIALSRACRPTRCTSLYMYTVYAPVRYLRKQTSWLSLWRQNGGSFHFCRG